MDKFFSIFGKFIFAIIILGTIGGAGFYAGRLSAGAKGLFTKTQKENTTQPQAAQPTPTTSVTSATSSATTPTKGPPKTVTAGLPTSTGLSFGTYAITVPDGWTVTKEHDESVPADTVTATNGLYQLKIYQAATGGNVCLYPGDAAFEGPSSKYDTFVTITATDGTIYRRGSTGGATGGKKGYTVCHKTTDNFQAPTKFGHISYSVPTDSVDTILKEMDSMLMSLKKQ